MRERLLSSSPPATAAPPLQDHHVAHKAPWMTSRQPPPHEPTAPHEGTHPRQGTMADDTCPQDATAGPPLDRTSRSRRRRTPSSSTTAATTSSALALPASGERIRLSSSAPIHGRGGTVHRSGRSGKNQPSNNGSGTTASQRWETFYAHYKATREARRRSLAEELQLAPQVAALFAPPSSYTGTETASAVLEGRLFVGSACTAQDPIWLRANGITHVLNVADEVTLNEALFQEVGITYRWIGAADRTFVATLRVDDL